MEQPRKGRIRDAYSRGTQLRLLPHIDTPGPYGTSYYPWPGEEDEDFDANVDKYPVGYNPKEIIGVERHLVVEVVETISGGEGCQILLLKVIEVPTSQSFGHKRITGPSSAASSTKEVFLVGKFYDYMFFSTERDVFSRPFSVAQAVDQDYSREAFIYDFCHQRGKDRDNKPIEGQRQLTGPPNIIPEYYGTWVTKLVDNRPVVSIYGTEPDKNPVIPDNERYVGIILMGHVEGHPLEDYFKRHYITDRLVPNPAPTGNDSGRLYMSYDDRLKILKSIIRSIVIHLHYGIQHEDFYPEDLIVSKGADGDLFVVNCGFSLSTVWSLSKEAKQHPKRRNEFKRLPNPIHPLEIFHPDDFPELPGLIPEEWVDEEKKPREESLWGKWLLKEFGDFKEDVPGYHYSVFSTLDEMDAKRRAERAAAKKLKAESQKAQDNEPPPSEGSSRPEGTSKEDLTSVKTTDI